MATVAAASYQRRKKITTYGKANRSSPYNAAQFDAFFEDSNPQSDAFKATEANAPVRQKERPSKRTKYEASKTSSDAFDVPSSEDEEHKMVTTKPPSPPKLRALNKLVEDEAAERQLLASWERKDSEHTTSSRSGDDPVDRPNRCDTQDAENADSKAGVAVIAIDSGTPASALAPRAPTAAARLAARKRAGDLPKLSSKSSEGRALGPDVGGPKAKVASTTPRKRRRDRQDSGSEAVRDQATAAHDPTSQKNGELRMSMRKDLSAPARLVDMLSGGLDKESVIESDEAAHNDHDALPETPATKEARSPARLRRAESLTPKQVQLWDQLLPSNPAADSPGRLPLQRLRLAERRGDNDRLIHNKSPSNPVGARRRARLVDSLKASLVDFGEDELEDSDNNGSRSDLLAEKLSESDYGTLGTAEAEVSSLTNAHEATEPQPQLVQAASQSGPKMTYARTRSYLQEESLEDGILGSMTESIAPHPRRSANTTDQRALAAQGSTFDLEDSDDEGSQGRLKTIHELRAAGRTRRFAQSAEALLDDIAAHGVTARSRRRAALLDLASQLLDQDFARQCVDQGFEQQLFRELSYDGDAVANVMLATVVALLLNAAPPEHSVLALYSNGGLTKLAALFNEHATVTNLAKMKAQNMSKASQVALSAFLTRLQCQTSLWGEQKPTTISPRLMGLKAADLVLERLKNTKHSPAMLSDDALSSVLPEQNNWDNLELSIAVSILEVVSLCSPLLFWPEGILSRVGTLLENLEARAPTTGHTWFLTFRLSASLTNRSERNCTILGTPKAVERLLSAALDGFTRLGAHVDEEQRKLDFDLLVLSIGILFNLTLYTAAARASAIDSRSSPTLSALIDTLVDGQEAIPETETLEQTTRNIPFGYLAVMLANLCQNLEARDLIAAQLPGQGLQMLLTAVAEFVQYHEQVDTIVLEGDEGASVWGAYTGKMRVVLSQLEDVEGSK